MLTKADEGGEGVSQMLTIALLTGGGGGYEPPILADVICEQPPTRASHVANKKKEIKFSNLHSLHVFVF